MSPWLIACGCQMTGYTRVGMPRRFITYLNVRRLSWGICSEINTHTNDIDAKIKHHYGVVNHQQLDCLFNSLSRLTTKKTPRLRNGSKFRVNAHSYIFSEMITLIPQCINTTLNTYTKLLSQLSWMLYHKYNSHYEEVTCQSQQTWDVVSFLPRPLYKVIHKAPHQQRFGEIWTTASKPRGGHSHQLPYGGVPLYRVDFERPVSLK